MQYCGQAELVDYLNFSTSTQAPVKAVACSFAGQLGALEVFSLFVFASVGLGLTIRTRHPGPILVAIMLTTVVVAATLPGQAAQIMALVVFLGVSALGIYLYARAQSSL